MEKTLIKFFSLGALTVSLVVTLGWFMFSSQSDRDPSSEEMRSKLPSLFSEQYPVATRFQVELGRLRSTNQLSQQNEALIERSVNHVSTTLKQPPALLWCLLFQESRLNHLSGMDGDAFISGLGQFSKSAFFEINKDLSRYFSEPSQTMSELLGKDARPIRPDKSNPASLSSYYNIPTAVSASALFLHNRWIQLQRVASARKLTFSNDVLWVWAALSYNKGGRSIVSIWRQIEKEQGKAALQSALQSPSHFLKTVHSSALMQRALLNIWDSNKATIFAKELSIHSQNLTDCALAKPKGKGDL